MQIGRSWIGFILLVTINNHISESGEQKFSEESLDHLGRMLASGSDEMIKVLPKHTTFLLIFCTILSLSQLSLYIIIFTFEEYNSCRG